MDEYRRRVGQRLLELREAQGLSQEALAHAADLSTKTISRWENGQRMPRGSNLEKVAKVLKVARSDILGEPPAPLGLGVETEATQLERIEAKLDAVLQLLHEEALDAFEEALSVDGAAGERSLGTATGEPEESAGATKSRRAAG